MQAPFSLFLALRYLKPKRTVISIIPLVTITGVALGVTTLILVIAVMTGFDHELRRKVLGFDAHVLVTSQGVMREWRELDEKIAKAPHVLATAPFVQGPVIAEFEGKRLAPKIRGIDIEREQLVTGIGSAIKEGKLDLEADEQGNSNKAVVGRELANELGVTVGDKITIYSPGNLSEIVEVLNQARKSENQDQKKTLDELQQMILPADLTITGIFESGRFVYDAEFILVPLHIGQELYGLGDALHGITMKTDDPDRVDAVKEELLRMAPIDTQVFTWIDLNKQFFDAIHMERNTMFFILFIIVIVAAFSITNTLITVSVQKTREIGIMKALGATSWQIVGIFMLQGMMYGVLGNALGLALGMTLLRWRNEVKDFLAWVLGMEIFPASVYQLSAIPAEIVPSDVAIICLGAMAICSLAALLPSFMAAHQDPVKALRFD